MHLDGILPYAGLLQTAECRYNKETSKSTWYLDFENQEDIKLFLNYAKGAAIECCDHIAALSKMLYYCDREELDKLEIDNIISLAGTLGRFASFLLWETEEKTLENTKPKASINNLK